MWKHFTEMTVLFVAGKTSFPVAPILLLQHLQYFSFLTALSFSPHYLNAWNRLRKFETIYKKVLLISGCNKVIYFIISSIKK